MNSKERVLAAANLKQPDRIPVDFSANRWTLEKLYIDTGTRDYRRLLEFFHSDILDIRGVIDPVYKGPVPFLREFENGIRENFWGWRTKIVQTAAGPEEFFAEFVLKDASSIREVAEHNWPKVDWFDFSDFSSMLDSWQDFAVMASGASIWQHPSFLRSPDSLLMDIAMSDEIGVFIIDKYVEFYVKFFDKMFSSAPGKVDILRIADDIGMQDRLLFSPGQFKDFLAPRIKKIVDMAHSHNVKVMFHSCGAIEPLIEDIISIGVDILDPLQVTAAGMEPKILKGKYGRRICLHGSIDTQYLLPQGSVEDVRIKVKNMIDVLGKDGGFILSPTHVLQNDVPVENIKALYSTANKFGCYQ